MDPANGFTAISGLALANLPLEKIDDRFFFEQERKPISREFIRARNQNRK